MTLIQKFARQMRDETYELKAASTLENAFFCLRNGIVVPLVKAGKLTSQMLHCIKKRTD